MQRLIQAVEQGAFLLDLEETDLRKILTATLDQLASQKLLPKRQRSMALKGLMAREEETSTAIGHAVSVPHFYEDSIARPLIAFVRLAKPTNLGAPDGIPVRFLIVLLGPSGHAAEHLDTLMSIARLMSDDDFRYEAGVAKNQKELVNAIHGFEFRTGLTPDDLREPTRSPEGLEYTGKFAGGLTADIQRKSKHWVSDFRDGLSSKVLASTLFLFFACLAPAVAFGGLMSLGTGGEIGIIERIVGVAVCGIIYALLSGQPLIILGGTGPLLIFTIILYQLADAFGLPFLPVYAWTGVWAVGFLFILVLTDASSLLRYFTRFTDEIFAALISLIFISEAVKKLVAYTADARDGSVEHDIAFLSILLALGTFFVASSLSRFRGSKYLGPSVREFFADFGPTIAVGLMVAITFLFPNVTLETLSIPAEFKPTADRSWLVNLFPAEMPVWAIFAAAAPALFLTVLMFLDQSLTSRLVNNPDYKLRKGPGFHLDLLVVTGLMLFSSLLGLPWFVAATVRSLNHVRSLAQTEKRFLRDGSVQEHVIHVQENRLSSIGIHVLIGASLLFLNQLQYIPMSVLYGLFLYMGVVSMRGNQFFERFGLLLTEKNLYPQTHYVRKVPIWTIHCFTLVQAACLAVLWMIKAAPPVIAMLFPIMIALLVPVRMVVGRYFSEEDLAALDSEHIADEEIPL